MKPSILAPMLAILTVAAVLGAGPASADMPDPGRILARMGGGGHGMGGGGMGGMNGPEGYGFGRGPGLPTPGSRGYEDPYAGQMRRELRRERRALSDMVRGGKADPSEVERKLEEIERLERRLDSVR